MRKNQPSLFKKELNSAYGGKLLTSRAGRSRGRPLATRKTMHLVLRSSKATGKYSFRRNYNLKKVTQILQKFSAKYAVGLISVAVHNNHIHLHLKLSNRHTYRPFIRAITSAIAVKVSGAGKGRPIRSIFGGTFWDRRPFTRVVYGIRDFLGLNRYLQINEIEAHGYTREYARYLAGLIGSHPQMDTG